MTWQVSDFDFVFSPDVPAYLCRGEEDWYYFETENLEFDDPHLLMFAEINDANRCAAACGNPAVKPGPKYAMTVEVYRADTMQLLDSGTSDDGEVLLGGPGDYLHDLLIRVYSPTPKARYPYVLWILLADGPTGDDCEC